MQERVRSGNAMSIRFDLRNKMEVFHRNTGFISTSGRYRCDGKAAEYLMGTHDFPLYGFERGQRYGTDDLCGRDRV